MQTDRLNDKPLTDEESAQISIEEQQADEEFRSQAAHPDIYSQTVYPEDEPIDDLEFERLMVGKQVGY